MVKPTGGAPLALDPGDYQGTYKLVGGRICLDFVNTVSYPLGDQSHDWLDGPDNALDWALAVEIIGQATTRWLMRRARSNPGGAKRALGRIRRQRAIVTRVLSPIAHGEGPADDDVAALNGLLTSIGRYRTVDPTRWTWTWDTPRRLDQIIRPVILDAADLLTGSDHSRIGVCPGCDWLFYDTTRNRSRRWCDMADCGSRDKALRYYYRTRGKPGAT